MRLSMAERTLSFSSTYSSRMALRLITPALCHTKQRRQGQSKGQPSAAGHPCHLPIQQLCVAPGRCGKRVRNDASPLRVQERVRGR